MQPVLTDSSLSSGHEDEASSFTSDGTSGLQQPLSSLRSKTHTAPDLDDSEHVSVSSAWLCIDVRLPWLIIGEHSKSIYQSRFYLCGDKQKYVCFSLNYDL